MNIKDLKQPYKALALVRQKEQKGVTDENAPLKRAGCAFIWAYTKERHDWWGQIEEGNYPPIPPDSLKDIPLQVRWDSGERFRQNVTNIEITELHTFKNGKIGYTVNRDTFIQTNEENFLRLYEPIPSEPQTRWVNVFLADSATCNFYDVLVGLKEEKATFSVQQKLVNSKWMNV